MRYSRILTSIIVCSLLGINALQADEPQASNDWTQWRGPNRDGKISVAQWPSQISGEAMTELWSVPLGPGYSGPIVVGDRVFVTETKDKRVEIVRALDRKTGKELWKTEWQGAMKVPFFAKSNGDWIRSTPAFDDGRLYVAGMRDVLVCLDASSGEKIWRVDFVEQLGTPLPQFGFVCSPLVVDDAVYVQAGASFVKMDKRTGKILWRALGDGGGMYGSAFSSPTLAELAGTRQLVVQTRSTLAGIDIENGKELWQREIPAFRGMNIVTPTIHGDSVFTSSYGGNSLLLELAAKNDSFTASAKWTNGKQGYMSSPVTIGNHVYLHLKNRRFTCIDLSSGEVTWTTKAFGKYWSLIANGDRILALDETGDLRLIRSNPKQFELLDSRKVAENSWAHLAVSGDEIFVRDLGAIKAFQWNMPQESTPVSE